MKPPLSERQHGFVPGRSCATNLATMLHTAWSNISAGSQTDVIYTNYSSAFQSVNHKLLLHKLKHYFHISDKAFDWCESYLSGRQQRVVVKGKCSEWVPASSGTPEGGILSPLLFACFANDLPMNVDTDMRTMLSCTGESTATQTCALCSISWIPCASGLPRGA